MRNILIKMSLSFILYSITKEIYFFYRQDKIINMNHFKGDSTLIHNHNTTRPQNPF